MADPTIDVRNPVAPRGGTFEVTVSVGDADPAKARVELLLVERKLEALVDVKRNHARVLVSAPIEAPDQTIGVGVPIDLPDPYRGERIGWDYELRLVVDRLGPDTRSSIPVVVGGDVDHGGDPGIAPVLGREAVSRPGHMGGPQNGSAGDFVFLCLAMIGLGIPPLWVGLTAEGSGRWIAVGVGVVALAAAVAVAIAGLQIRRHRLGSDVWWIPEGPFRRGDTIAVPVAPRGTARLEVGLLTIELEVTNAGRRRTATAHTIGEEWHRTDDDHAMFVVPPTLPPTYAGEEVAVQWMLVIRDGSLSDSGRDASRRFEAIRVW